MSSPYVVRSSARLSTRRGRGLVGCEEQTRGMTTAAVTVVHPLAMPTMPQTQGSGPVSAVNCTRRYARTWSHKSRISHQRGVGWGSGRANANEGLSRTWAPGTVFGEEKSRCCLQMLSADGCLPTACGDPRVTGEREGYCPSRRVSKQMAPLHPLGVQHRTEVAQLARRDPVVRGETLPAIVMTAEAGEDQSIPS